MSRIALYTFFILTVFQGRLYSQQVTFKNEIREFDLAVTREQYLKALQHIEAAIELEPYNLEALEKKINIYYLQDEAKLILKKVEDLIKLHPVQPEYYYMRALLRLHKEKYLKAIDDFNASLEFGMPSENIYKIYLNMGMAHLHYENYELAEESFQKALDLKPGFALIYHSRGMLKYETKEYEAAVENFVKAIQLEDTNPITYYNLGMTYFRLEELDNACYYFNKSCSLGHRNACRLQLMECADEINIPQ